MTFRLYSVKNKLYTNDLDFRSFSQDSVSIWSIQPDGKILELIYYPNQEDDLNFQIHPSEDFIIEPWTGYFDKDGKKIYCGDILKMESFFTFESKVIWEHGSFFMVPIDPEGLKNTMGHNGILDGWTITGNIHEVEYSEGK